jgi:hypothetical protein
VRAQEGQVLLGELVLQCLGRRRDDDVLARQQRGHEVAERLAGARAGLHDHVATGGDALGDGARHLALSFACLAAAGELRGDEIERAGRVVGGGGAGHGRSVASPGGRAGARVR